MKARFKAAVLGTIVVFPATAKPILCQVEVVWKRLPVAARPPDGSGGDSLGSDFPRPTLEPAGRTPDFGRMRRYHVALPRAKSLLGSPPPRR